MTVIEVRTMEIICRNMPSISSSLTSIASSLDSIANSLASISGVMLGDSEFVKIINELKNMKEGGK